jgi:hypothetical protein
MMSTLESHKPHKAVQGAVGQGESCFDACSCLPLTNFDDDCSLVLTIHSYLLSRAGRVPARLPSNKAMHHLVPRLSRIPHWKSLLTLRKMISLKRCEQKKEGARIFEALFTSVDRTCARARSGVSGLQLDDLLLKKLREQQMNMMMRMVRLR